MEAGPFGEDTLHRGGRIAAADDLDLARHDRVVGDDLEAAGVAHQGSRVADGGDDGGLLDHHRHHIVAAVDEEVEADADGQFEEADHILDHLVCHREGQRGPLRSEQERALLGRHEACGLKAGHPLVTGEAIEAGDT